MAWLLPRTLILIESQWNLKPIPAFASVCAAYDINRITVEFKVFGNPFCELVQIVY